MSKFERYTICAQYSYYIVFVPKKPVIRNFVGNIKSYLEFVEESLYEVSKTVVKIKIEQDYKPDENRNLKRDCLTTVKQCGIEVDADFI